jgi:curved DNA-binding protein CbpA
VRIPLDYYRILGLPILATADQIRQAYRDRTLQLPRQEFSTQAVASRKALLKQAYDLLTQDEKRRDYDARFLATTYESNAETPSPPATTQTSDIEVEESQFVGGLVLLQELGEYESVLRLGRPYLNPTNTAIKEARLGEPQAALSDIVLAISLACLELGREEWQQGHYDNAAEALETGQELLMREGLFPAVRAEVQSDLYKLRPYRILAMLSDPDEDAPIRQRGLEMLRDMLGDRQGIDGNGIDQSGLGVDDFLRFIQQLRDYMTVDEQQALFEAEARRPSAVATYLSVYALMAKGFARQEPALIRRAKPLAISA